MRFLNMVFAAAVSCVAVPASGQAATQTISFTVDVSGSGSSPVPPEVATIDVSSASFPGFDPSLGTLTEIAETVTGSTVVTTSAETTRETVFVRLNDVGAVQTFSPTDPISIDLSGTTMDASALARFTGGMPSVMVQFVVTLAGGELGSSVSASVGPSTLDGTITYTFTPAATTPVPEPSTWAMMFIGFGGLGFLGYRQTRKAEPQAA